MKRLMLIPLLLLLSLPANAASLKDVHALNAEIERGNIGAVKALEEEAQKGDAEAQAKLGMFYLYTPARLGFQDDARSVEWLMRAAKGGHALAAQTLGLIHEQGYGVPRDMYKALKWYREAAELGDSHSQEVMGRHYMNGYVLPKSDAHAIEWYNRAAEQKNHNAMHALATLYRAGIGVDRDIVQAAVWCELAMRNYPAPAASTQLANECIGINGEMTKIRQAVVKKRLKAWEDAHAHVAGPKR